MLIIRKKNTMDVDNDDLLAINFNEIKTFAKGLSIYILFVHKY